jgi:hypothetical protein
MTGASRFVGLGLILLVVATACEGNAAVRYQSPAPSPASASWNFDGDTSGAAPAGADVFSGTWVIRAEADAPSRPNALCQTGNADFPALALGGGVYGDVTVTMRFKPISGKVDQAAGIISRVQDKDNYYIVRANVLETNVNLYKYAGGRRSGIKDGSVNVDNGKWQELRMELTGHTLRGFLDGKLVVEANDGTFKAGRIGLWTKADSVTCFDDLVVTPR